jgi:hypothetical protein
MVNVTLKVDRASITCSSFIYLVFLNSQYPQRILGQKEIILIALLSPSERIKYGTHAFGSFITKTAPVSNHHPVNTNYSQVLDI